MREGKKYSPRNAAPFNARAAAWRGAKGPRLRARKLLPACVDGKKDRGTSLIRDSAPLGPYSRTMPRALRWS